VQIESRRFEGAAGSETAGPIATLVAAGGHADGQFRCVECGYGVTVRRSLPTCPMCRGRMWEPLPGSEFAPPAA
jgi:hypothetical protein